MALSLAKKKGKSALPTQKALYWCMKLGTTAAASDYLYKQMTKRLQASGAAGKESEGLVQQLKEHTDMVHLSSKQDNVWVGYAEIRNPFQNLQHRVAERAAESLSHKLNDNVLIAYAISDEGKFMRGYLSEGKLLDAVSAKELDYTVNAWLCKHQLVNQGSTIYQITTEGKQIPDPSGNSKKADVENLKKLIADPVDGLGAFVQESIQKKKDAPFTAELLEQQAKPAKVEEKPQQPRQKVEEKPVQEAPVPEEEKTHPSKTGR